MRALWLLLAPVYLFAQTDLDSLLKPEIESLNSLYIHLHQNPELSYREKETGARMAQELRAAGFTVTENVGGFGVVGVMKNGPGQTVLVRTDLDGLPVDEKTGRAYASKVRTKNDQGIESGVMHACGHDIHMSAFVGTARMLAKLKDKWKGTVVMIGQPAEERGGGALAMLKDGLYTRFPRPNVALALHTDAALETGYIGYREGFGMANVDSIDLTIRGLGGHGAYPHATRDPVVLAAQIILALQTIVSREVKAIDAGVVTVGSIHGGTKHNIIPDEVKLQITVRSYEERTREMIIGSIRRIATNTARAFGIPEDRLPVMTLVNEDFTPATYNNPALVKRLAGVWKKTFGEAKVVERDPEMGGEDFSRYGMEEPRIPIVLFRLGTIDAARVEEAKRTGQQLPSLHSSQYWPVPNPTIETGVKAMTAAVLDLLKP